jgi:hypothetical protein
MSLLGAFALGIAVGVSLEALVLSLLAGWRDTPANPRLGPPPHEGQRGGERWKLQI